LGDRKRAYKQARGCDDRKSDSSRYLGAAHARFIDMSKETAPGVTDGLRVDTKGNLYETGPGGIWIVSPEGKHLGTIQAPEISTNVGFGDADKKTLYIAARTGIYKIRVNTPRI